MITSVSQSFHWQGRGWNYPQRTFLHMHITRTSRPAAKNSFGDFSWICFLHGMVLVLTSYDFASDVMMCQNGVIFWEKYKLASTPFIQSGIVENCINHELYHLNNEIAWWHDVTHDNMSSHDIRDMTSRYDFISWISDVFYMSLWFGTMSSLLFRAVLRSSWSDTF